MRESADLFFFFCPTWFQVVTYSQTKRVYYLSSYCVNPEVFNKVQNMSAPSGLQVLLSVSFVLILCSSVQLRKQKAITCVNHLNSDCCMHVLFKHPESLHLVHWVYSCVSYDFQNYSIPGWFKIFFSCPDVQTNSVAHQSSCSMGIRILSRG
jgi:hypothetical protein